MRPVTPRHPGFARDRICWLWRLDVQAKVPNLSLLLRHALITCCPTMSHHDSPSIQGPAGHSRLTCSLWVPVGCTCLFSPLHVSSCPLPPVALSAATPHLDPLDLVIFLFCPPPWVPSSSPCASFECQESSPGYFPKKHLPSPWSSATILLAPSRHLVGGRSWGFGVGTNQRGETGIYGHDPVPSRVQNHQSLSHKATSHKPQTQGKKRPESGSCDWVGSWSRGGLGPASGRELLSLGVSTGEVFILQWHQAKGQAAAEMPHVFWLW